MSPDERLDGGRDPDFARNLALLILGQAAALGLACVIGWMLTLLIACALALLWKLGPDARSPHVACLLVAVVTLYTQGGLIRYLSAISAFALLATVLAAREYRLRGWKIPVHPLTLALAAWIGVTLLGLIYGLVLGNNVRYAGIDLAGALALGTALFGPLWRARRGGKKIALAVFVAITYVSAMFGLYFFFLYKRRLGDAWFSPVPPIGALVLLCVALHARNTIVRWGAAALAFVPLTNLLLSFTRANWLAFLMSLASVAALYIWASPKRGRAVLLVTQAGAVLVGAGWVALLMSQLLLGGELGTSVEQRFGSSFSTEASSNTYSNLIRLVEWQNALSGIRQAPLTGYGAGGTLITKDPFLGSRAENPFVHEMYIFQAYKYGIVGLLALLFLFAVFARAGALEARRGSTWQRRALGSAVFGSTILIAVVSLFDFALAHVTVSLPLAFLWGLLVPVATTTAGGGQGRVEWADEMAS